MAKKNKKSKKVSKNATVKKEFQRKANVQYQDSLFRTLFSKKENAIELYNALEGTDYGPDTNIDINTLEEVFFHDRRNDLSFVIDTHYVVMAEQQSTKSMNMPLRLLGYAARTLEKWCPTPPSTVPASTNFRFQSSTSSIPAKKLGRPHPAAVRRLSAQRREPGNSRKFYGTGGAKSLT